jgi:hypothetical protein
VLKDRDEIADKLHKTEKQLDKLKSAPKPVTVHLSQENFSSTRSTQQLNIRLEEENDFLNAQVGKLQHQLRDLRDEL